MKKAVLFDLDGTLVDTAPDFSLAVNDLRTSLKLSVLPAQTVAQYVSNGSFAITEIATGLSGEHPNFKQHQQQLLSYYSQHIGTAATIYAGLRELLQHFDKQQIKWGIVTNKPAIFAEPLLCKLKLQKNCSTLICPDHVKQPKPHPEALLLASAELNIEHSECIYVGDHLRDIQAGNAANMTTIAATYGYTSNHENPNQWQADHIAKTPQSLCQLLKTLTATP